MCASMNQNKQKQKPHFSVADEKKFKFPKKLPENKYSKNRFYRQIEKKC